MLRALAYYAAPIGLVFLALFPEIYRPRSAGAGGETSAGRLVERTLLAGLGLLGAGALLGILGQLKFRWAIPLFFLLPLYACWRLDRLGVDAARRRRLRTYAGVLVIAEALMVAGILLQVHLGARLGVPSRLNTPYDAVATAVAAAGFRQGTIVAGHGPLGGNLRLAFPSSRVVSLEAPGYLPAPAAGGSPGQCLVVWDGGAADGVPEVLRAYLRARLDAEVPGSAADRHRGRAPPARAGPRVSRVLPPSARGRRRLPVTARLGLVALAVVAALGLVEGLLRVAAHLDPRVRFLATGRASRPAVTYATLEEFVAAQAPYITPRRPWFNYWSNALGFHDEEFVEPKPPGRLRVLAVGDSFTFGPVPYPQSVMTLTENGLRAACGGRALDLLNMGVMGAGSPEYRSLAELGASRYSPDLVLVNLFLGNDPPDLHRHVHDRSPVERLLRRSYAWTLVKNFRRARGGLREARLPARVGAAPAGAPVSRGGERVEGSTDLTADDPALVGPLLSDAAYQEVLASDLGRFYRPAEPQDLADGLARPARRSRRAGPRRVADGEPGGAGVPAVGPPGGRRAAGRDGVANERDREVPGTVRRPDRSRPAQRRARRVRAGARHSARGPDPRVRRRARRRPGASVQAKRHPLDAAREPRRRGGARRLPGAARLPPLIGRTPTCSKPGRAARSRRWGCRPACCRR